MSKPLERWPFIYGRWVHVAVIQRDGVAELYIDGTLVPS